MPGAGERFARSNGVLEHGVMGGEENGAAMALECGSLLCTLHVSCPEGCVTKMSLPRQWRISIPAWGASPRTVRKQNP